MKITKLIIPAAGIGSRFLPITKSIPKEMLPLSNKPAIEYIVQEAYDADIVKVGIILSPEKNVIKEYFEPNTHLDNILAEKNQSYRVAGLNSLIEHINFSYFYQYNPAGLADALMQAKTFIKDDELFAVALPDDIIFGTTPEILYLMQIAEKMQGMVIAVQEVPLENISSYGVIQIDKKIDENCYQIASLVEKPKMEDAPSNLAIVGRYVFHADLFSFIPKTPLTTSSEILLPDTINLMIKSGYPVFAYKVQGERFDTGTPQGWLKFIMQNNNF
ncbi:UTP--glucose-1-phosphate uridylyltransferase [Candidatus Chromulinivorax destructor]|uniref:UTP--glucose-1-phosphate uridylyltransferase n=1 Tax=Candidatus Chromulinivorax destructor TaxID=2066483 RepID=A0A345ZAL6_9BACT|nr:UTP--glucose-1-phosphate uridylyltransferase [Candidatus Chromulinivorax destructor]AXK60333.1 UTP--glucose-1-phosphate uridylyltransferase [Candidatus Chromulinivorax destructor]